MGITSATNDRVILSVRALPLTLFVTLLTLCAFLHVGVAQAYADDIGSITVDGATRNYSQLKDLSETLEGYEGKTLTVDMLTDWDASWGHTEFDYRLVIPKNSNVTFNMHGHIFNRNNVNEDDDYSPSGEVIYIYPGATLTINGAADDEEKQSVHEGVRIFTDVNQEIARHTTTITGACIAGGNSTGGTGGIYIDSGKDCVLNDVTIAGCKAENSSNPFVSHHDDGGVLITESGTKLKLNNSTITGCLASGDGGGAMMPNDSDENVSIELDNGHIDSNYANDSGGGVNLDGTNVSISGKNGSTISNNICLN